MLKRITVQAGTDEPIAIRLRKVSSGSVTSVTVTTATNIVLITSDGGTDTYAFATYTTVGAVADAINADAVFEAKVLDCLRSHASASAIVDGAITSGTDAYDNVVWDALVDTSAALFIAANLSPRRDFDAPKGHRVHLLEWAYGVNMGTAAANSAQIYLRRKTTERLVWQALSVDTTVTTLNFASGEAGITGNTDEDIIFKVKDAATLANDTLNFVRVVGLLE